MRSAIGERGSSMRASEIIKRFSGKRVESDPPGQELWKMQLGLSRGRAVMAVEGDRIIPVVSSSDWTLWHELGIVLKMNKDCWDPKAFGLQQKKLMSDIAKARLELDERRRCYAASLRDRGMELNAALESNWDSDGNYLFPMDGWPQAVREVYRR